MAQSSSAVKNSKVGFDNPMHLDVDIEGARARKNTVHSPLRDSFPPESKNGNYPSLSGESSPEKEIRSRIVDIDGTKIDMNATYTIGSQEWYLQDRRKVRRRN